MPLTTANPINRMTDPHDTLIDSIFNYLTCSLKIALTRRLIADIHFIYHFQIIQHLSVWKERPNISEAVTANYQDLKRQNPRTPYEKFCINSEKSFFESIYGSIQEFTRENLNDNFEKARHAILNFCTD